MEYREYRRKRAASHQVVVKRAALAAVQPVMSRIGEWQSTAARLRTHYMLERDAGRRVQLAAQGQQLLQMVTQSAERLARDANELPPNVVNNGRYQDVLRALQSVTATLESFAFPPDNESGRSARNTVDQTLTN